jgi:peroxiredoxin
MATPKNKYPDFDLSEIIPDNDLIYRIYQPLKPVKAGNAVPGFSLKTDYKLWRRFYNGGETHGPILTNDLLNKPLVIGFYSKHWHGAGLRQLIQLNALQNEIRANGGNLLIISAENDEALSGISWKNNLSLSFYHDIDNEIAKKFRVYSESDPAWNRFSGIDVNVPLLATYVIDPAKQIMYDNTDQHYAGSISSAEIISAVYESALIRNSRRSA